MKNVLIIGATSAMANQCARIYASYGSRIFLLGRNLVRLQEIQADLKVRGASDVYVKSFDFNDLKIHSEVLDEVTSSFDKIDICLVAHGSLTDQKRSETEINYATEEIITNFVSAVSLISLVANKMVAKKNGRIAAISSVAGDRGRQSNYLYGSCKSGLTTFLQGLRNRLFHHGVQVITIKPGFIDTPMTAGMKKGALFCSAEKAGLLIHRAIERGCDTVYVPGFWRLIMFVITSIPETLFKRLRL